MPLSMIPVFLIVLVVRLGEGQGWLPVWARSYGDDLAVMPLVLWMIQGVHRKVRKNPVWRLPNGHGLLSVLFFLLLFEWILPGFFNRGTADYWDGWMYGLGFAYFYFLVNRHHENGLPSVDPMANSKISSPILF